MMYDFPFLCFPARFGLTLRCSYLGDDNRLEFFRFGLRLFVLRLGAMFVLVNFEFTKKLHIIFDPGSVIDRSMEVNAKTAPRQKINESGRDYAIVTEAIEFAKSKGRRHVKIDIMFASTVKTLQSQGFTVDEGHGNDCVILW